MTTIRDQHYQVGIRLNREEKLPDAIAEWTVVLDLGATEVEVTDPAH